MQKVNNQKKMKSVWKHQLKCRSIKLFIILPTALISIRENASHFISRYNQNETQLLHVRLVQTLYKLEIPGSLLQIPFLPSHGWIEWGLSSSHQMLGTGQVGEMLVGEWGAQERYWSYARQPLHIVPTTPTVIQFRASPHLLRSHYCSTCAKDLIEN